jgi:hypothetical protein
MEIDSVATLSGRIYAKSTRSTGAQGELSEPEPPGWMADVQARCAELESLPVGWDTYGARQIPVATIRAALGILSRIAGQRSPGPTVYPIPSGGVNFVWQVGPKCLEVEVLTPGRVAASMANDDTGVEWEDPDVGSDLTRVVEALRSLETP